MERHTNEKWRWETHGIYPRLFDPLPPTSRISASRDSSEAPRDRTRQSHEPLELHTSTVWTTTERPIHGLHSTIILADGPLTVDATLHRDTNLTPKELGPTLPWCLQHRGLFHPLSQFQNEVIQDIRNLVEGMHEETMEWFRGLPQHVQSAYQREQSVTHKPVLIHLLRLLNYPRTDTLYHELPNARSWGELTPGVNWYVRQDQKYLDPTPIPEFRPRIDSTSTKSSNKIESM